jgi:plastocyanin domain-containing protein
MNTKTWLTLSAAYALLAAGSANAQYHGLPPRTPQVRTIEVAVTSDGFVPTEIHVKKGEQVTLVVTRTSAQTCATSIVIKDLGVKADLPIGKPVTVTIKPSAAGKIRYACPEDMVAGTIVVD